MLGKLDSYMQKNQVRLSSHTVHKNKFKAEQTLTCNTWIHKTSRKNRQYAVWHCS